MSEYKNSILKELGIKDSKTPTVRENAFPGIDPDEQDANMQEPKAQEPSARDRMMSPTAISTPVLAIAVRGSSTGGLPSGTNLTPSKLGGYEPIDTAKENSLVVDKTPTSGPIASPEPIAKEEDTNTPAEEHPHQVQNSPDQPPQAVTGASTETEPSLQLKTAMPQGIDVDVAEGEDEDNHEDNPEYQEKHLDQFRKDRSASPEGDEVRKELGINEGKHKAGCECGFCKNKSKFGKKTDKDKDKDKDKEPMDEAKEGIPTHRLVAIRESLQEKAVSGKMSKKESEVFHCLTEVLQRRGFGLEKKLFGKKTMLETAGVVAEKELPHEDVAAAWQDDKNGEYIAVEPDSNRAYYVAHGSRMEEIPAKFGNIWGGIKAWMDAKGFYPNIWSANDHGNVSLHSKSGRYLGGLV
jgi:hypothetical protein